MGAGTAVGLTDVAGETATGVCARADPTEITARTQRVEWSLAMGMSEGWFEVCPFPSSPQAMRVSVREFAKFVAKTR